MPTTSLQATAQGRAQCSARADTRYLFTGQFLEGAKIFSEEAAKIERDSAGGEALRAKHRACVCAAIMQASAALEADLAEVVMHGPSSYMGSNGTDAEARDFLKPLAEQIDRLPLLEGFKTVLHLLKKPALDLGGPPAQDATLLIRLRNEITHYKSLLGQEMEGKKLFSALEHKRFAPPPFAGNSNFFPHRLLGAECAKWAGSAARRFLIEFHSLLGHADRLPPWLN